MSPQLALTDLGVTELWMVPVSAAAVALIDAVDRELVEPYDWRTLDGHNGKVYAVAGGHPVVYMHRLITFTPDGMETDHRNGYGLDNRRCNLRVATASQNRANAGKPARPGGGSHSSRHKGVSWDRARRRWQSKIAVFDPSTGRSRHRNLGRYDDEDEAGRAYDVAALAAWGEFARLNFPSVR